jgi:hypothetical protein
MGPIVAFFALSALVWWVVVLAHEMGHAAVGLVRTEGLVVVRAGSRAPKWRRRFGRLKLELGPVPLPFQGSDGVAQVYARLARPTKVMLALAGPVAGGAAAGLFIVLGSRLQFLPLQIIGCLALLFDVANLLPFRFRGFRSDGALLVEALDGRHADRHAGDEQFDAIASRWLVLATNVHGAFAPRDRDLGARLSSKMQRARYDDDRETMAVHQLTFAGWCWREAEQGDTTPIRDSVLDARHRATQAGLSRADLIAVAAGELVRTGTDFAAGSPTPDSLELGLERARANPAHAELADEKARVAFCFGVALHDVATIAG